MEITRNFETAGGHKVVVTGKLVEFSNYSEFEMDIIVEGFGSQGGTPIMTRFSKNGIDYVARVGQLALTQEQLDIVFDIRRKLIIAKDKHPLNQEGTYEEVLRNKPWLDTTY